MDARFEDCCESTDARLGRNIKLKIEAVTALDRWMDGCNVRFEDCYGWINGWVS